MTKNDENKKTVLEYNDKFYPKFQEEGNAAQFAIPYAKYFCKGSGYDIGCNNEKWKFPGSTPIDLVINDEYHANNLPDRKVDYIFSSHCLEHIDRWVDTLDYWVDNLKEDGNLFLYLPDYSQEYWRPWNNRKHLHIFTSEIITDYLKTKGFNHIFSTGIDLNNSFMAIGIGK